MHSLLPLSVYCISLLAMQQMSALPAGEHLDTVRSDLRQKTDHQAIMAAPISEVHPVVSSPAAAAAQQPSSHQLAVSLKRAMATASLEARAAAFRLAWARPASDSHAVSGLARQVLPRQSLRRVRRNAHHHRHHHRQQHHHNSHHSKTNKEGCPLGTCSVHNLSHRLYQLIGEGGREISSPIHPRSPHSFG